MKTVVFEVGVKGIEPPKSWSQTKRLTIGPHPVPPYYITLQVRSQPQNAAFSFAAHFFHAAGSVSV